MNRRESGRIGLLAAMKPDETTQKIWIWHRIEYNLQIYINEMSSNESKTKQNKKLSTDAFLIHKHRVH